MARDAVKADTDGRCAAVHLARLDGGTVGKNRDLLVVDHDDHFVAREPSRTQQNRAPRW
jgi:hypothetical protein